VLGTSFDSNYNCISQRKFSCAFPPPYEETARVEKSKAAGQRLQYLQNGAASTAISCLNHMSVRFERKQLQIKYVQAGSSATCTGAKEKSAEHYFFP
jgi:hypothetical protein